jgi:hypothetical protein
MRETGRKFSGVDEFDDHSLNVVRFVTWLNSDYILYGIMDREVIQKVRLS